MTAVVGKDLGSLFRRTHQSLRHCPDALVRYEGRSHDRFRRCGCYATHCGELFQNGSLKTALIDSICVGLREINNTSAVAFEVHRYLAQLRDPYERGARLLPGLLVVAPIIVALAARFGARHPVLTTVGSVIGACGGMYALASIARGRGKALEERLVTLWGGMPTTIALRHRDRFLDSVSKGRYHELIGRKLGIALPTAVAEAADPAAADDRYVGATKRLRELTHGNRGLLYKENIAYGFHRNMLAMKPVGIAICLVAMVCAVAQGGLIGIRAPYYRPTNLADLDLASGLTLSVAVAFLLAWIFYFREPAVRRIGFVYAERLFECLGPLKTNAHRS
jgi:hypothetical protein